MATHNQQAIDAILGNVPAERRDFLRSLLVAACGLGAAAVYPASEVLAQDAGGGGKGKGGGAGGAGGGKGKGGAGGGKGKGGGGKGKGGGAGGTGTAAGGAGKCKGDGQANST